MNLINVDAVKDEEDGKLKRLSFVGSTTPAAGEEPAAAVAGGDDAAEKAS
jgi:hypothetical protein